ncbi:MAG TPA: hypothetical protein VNF06_01400 [Candidatus Aquilonibacter sp.]|nr:hypothetical protein [Candidatus Aquilonibacter sp.]
MPENKTIRKIYNDAKNALIAEVFVTGFWAAEAVRDVNSLKDALRGSGDPINSVVGIGVDVAAFGVLGYLMRRTAGKMDKILDQMGTK